MRYIYKKHAVSLQYLCPKSLCDWYTLNYLKIDYLHILIPHTELSKVFMTRVLPTVTVSSMYRDSVAPRPTYPV